MNKRDRQGSIKNNLNKLDFSKQSRYNVFNFSSANTQEHEQKKFDIFCDARRKGFVVITEAIFKEGGRADIYLPELDYVIEVLCSETEERFNNKNYPVKKTIAVRVNESFEV